MPACTLAVLARLGAMFERTASVRDDADLQEVLQDVARAIGEVLGYRAVVINVYRSAFDDMLTAAAVGSDESLHALLGTISPQDTWTPLLNERFRRSLFSQLIPKGREGAYFVPDGDFDWDALGVDTYVPDLEPPDDPNAWLPGDALFVPLRDARDQLLGVISVDEPETGMRPTDEELDVLVTISQHAALAMTSPRTCSTSACSSACSRCRRGSRRRGTWTPCCRPSRTASRTRSASTRS